MVKLMWQVAWTMWQRFYFKQQWSCPSQSFSDEINEGHSSLRRPHPISWMKALEHQGKDLDKVHSMGFWCQNFLGIVLLKNYKFSFYEFYHTIHLILYYDYIQSYNFMSFIKYFKFYQNFEVIFYYVNGMNYKFKFYEFYYIISFYFLKCI